MAQTSGSIVGGGKVGGKKGKKEAGAEARFDISPHILKEAELLHTELAIDKQLLHGQIREVDYRHVREIVENMSVNPPFSIDLVTWQHPGMPLSAPI